MSQLIMGQACFCYSCKDTLENVEKESNTADSEENGDTKLHHHLQAKTPFNASWQIIFISNFFAWLFQNVSCAF